MSLVPGIFRIAAYPAVRLLATPSVQPALFAFCVSRLIVLVMLILASQFTVPAPDPNSGIYEPDIVLPSASATADRLRQIIDVGDASWYIVIATYGYEQSPFDATEQHNWAFFPAYPLLLRAAASVTGEYQLTGMALSSLCFLVALILLHQYARSRGLDRPTADRVVFYLSIYPTAYFFSLPTTESLFLLVTLCAFLAAQHSRWWIAGLAGAIGSATRAAGILLLPALGATALMRLVHVQHHRASGVAVLLVPLGLIGFMAVLAADTGNAWAFRDVQAAWGRSPDPHTALLQLRDVLQRPNELSRSWDFRLLNLGALLLALTSTVVLLLRRDWDLAIYTVGCVGLPLTSGSLQALARYVMVLFPVFLVLGQAGRHPLLDSLIRTVFALLLGLLTALFAAHFTIALA
jgi:hypothetical protein